MSQINELPPEILEQIFIATLDLTQFIVQDPISYYSKLRVLRRVCRRWGQIIDHTPSLWRITPSEDTQSSTKMGLQKSQDGLIWVDARYFNQHAATFYATIFPAVHRIQFLQIGDRWLPEEAVGSAIQILSTAAPNLSVLKIYSRTNQTWTDRWFAGVAPKLKVLFLSGIAFKPFQPLLRGLRSISLTFEYTQSLAVEDLLEAVIESPQLEVLNVVRGLVGDSRSLPAQGSVQLNRLGVLCLEDVPAVPIRMLLGRIEVPNAQYVSLGPSETAVDDGILAMAAWIASHLSQIDSAEAHNLELLYITPYRMELRSAGRNYAIAPPSLDVSPACRVYEHVLSMLPSSFVEKVTSFGILLRKCYIFEQSVSEVEDLCGRVSERCPSLTRLVLFDYFPNVLSDLGADRRWLFSNVTDVEMLGIHETPFDQDGEQMLGRVLAAALDRSEAASLGGVTAVQSFRTQPFDVPLRHSRKKLPYQAVLRALRDAVPHVSHDLQIPSY